MPRILFEFVAGIDVFEQVSYLLLNNEYINVTFKFSLLMCFPLLAAYFHLYDSWLQNYDSLNIVHFFSGPP